jgi:hypothetical protein
MRRAEWAHGDRGGGPLSEPGDDLVSEPGTRHHHDVTDLRAAVTEFVHRYNTEWLIERHDHATPREAYRAAIAARAA